MAAHQYGAAHCTADLGHKNIADPITQKPLRH